MGAMLNHNLGPNVAVSFPARSYGPLQPQPPVLITSDTERVHSPYNNRDTIIVYPQPRFHGQENIPTLNRFPGNPGFLENRKPFFVPTSPSTPQGQAAGRFQPFNPVLTLTPAHLLPPPVLALTPAHLPPPILVSHPLPGPGFVPPVLYSSCGVLYPAPLPIYSNFLPVYHNPTVGNLPVGPVRYPPTPEQSTSTLEDSDPSPNTPEDTSKDLAVREFEEFKATRALRRAAVSVLTQKTIMESEKMGRMEKQVDELCQDSDTRLAIDFAVRYGNKKRNNPKTAQQGVLAETGTSYPYKKNTKKKKKAYNSMTLPQPSSYNLLDPSTSAGGGDQYFAAFYDKSHKWWFPAHLYGVKPLKAVEADSKAHQETQDATHAGFIPNHNVGDWPQHSAHQEFFPSNTEANESQYVEYHGMRSGGTTFGDASGWYGNPNTTQSGCYHAQGRNGSHDAPNNRNQRAVPPRRRNSGRFTPEPHDYNEPPIPGPFYDAEKESCMEQEVTSKFGELGVGNTGKE